MKVSIDFDYVPERQTDIHSRLENWGRWVKVKPQAWSQQPMFRMYRSKSWQWETPESRPVIQSLDAQEIEKTISHMSLNVDSDMAHVLRWAYVFPYIDPRKVGRNMGRTQDAMFDLLLNARDVVKTLVNQRKPL